MKPKLEHVQNFLNDLEGINYGGCGIAALSIYRWLKKEGQLCNTKFLYCYTENMEDRLLNNKTILYNKKGNPSIPSHIAIQHDGEYLDSEGRLNSCEYEWIQTVNQEKFLIKTINTKGWNYFFNRKDIKKIENFLEIDLSDIKISFDPCENIKFLLT